MYTVLLFYKKTSWVVVPNTLENFPQFFCRFWLSHFLLNIQRIVFIRKVVTIFKVPLFNVTLFNEMQNNLCNLKENLLELMFGNLKCSLFYWHTNAENNKHIRPNVYLSTGAFFILHVWSAAIKSQHHVWIAGKMHIFLFIASQTKNTQK